MSEEHAQTLEQMARVIKRETKTKCGYAIVGLSEEDTEACEAGARALRQDRRQIFAAGWRAGVEATDRFGEQLETEDDAWEAYLVAQASDPV